MCGSLVAFKFVASVVKLIVLSLELMHWAVGLR